VVASAGLNARPVLAADLEALLLQRQPDDVHVAWIDPYDI
jgi:hypothetical protein